MILIAPSILAADFANLETVARKSQSAGANYLHLDVMDGQFVPNITFGAPVIRCLRSKTQMFFDVHLMINEPIRYVEDFVKAGADMLTIHVEATREVKKTLDAIRALHVDCGIALSPATPVSAVLPYLPLCKQVLVMTVVPGFGGQALIPETLEKVRYLRNYIEENHLKLDIEVDGGITTKNAHEAIEAGANVIVAGSAIYGAKKMKNAIAEIRGAEVDQ